MTEEGGSKDQQLIELTTLALQRYRRLAECSKALEGAQRLLLSTLEYGRASKGLIEVQKARVEVMKREVIDLKKEAEEAESNLRRFKEKNNLI